MFFINRLSRVSNVSGSASLFASLLTFSLLVQAQVSEPVQAAVQSTGEEKQAVYHFPQWPKRQQVERVVVPPPPPGPYMSSALSGNSIKAPSFPQQVKKPGMSFSSSNVSMDNFSPDIPWPTNIRPPSRWIPESGYQYVAPQARNNRQQIAPATNQYGYRPQGQSMNWSGMPFNPNSGNNSTGGPAMTMPDMNWSNNRARGRNMPTNEVPPMGYPTNQNQMRRQSGNSNAYMPNRDPSRSAPRQGGWQ